MQTAEQHTNSRSNRSLPVEQWPESLEILRHLASHGQARSIRDIAREVAAPEISTRNRLARLEAAGAVHAVRSTSMLAPGKPVVCAHYNITQHGKDCAAGVSAERVSSFWTRATSVFSWSGTPEIRR